MAEERRISPAVIAAGAGAAIGIGALLYFLTRVEAAPPTPPPGLANLYGKVTDAGTGQPILGVLVSLNGLETYTNPGGNYAFADLEPGEYVLQFSKEGYETATSDIVLVEGSNELNIQMAPIVPVAVYRCVYCPATFSTEAGLVGHMSASHPGKPYLVYAYLSKDTVGFERIKMDGWSQTDWITIYVKVFTPAVAENEQYRFHFWFYRELIYAYWPCSPNAGFVAKGPAPEEFYVGESSDLRPRYLTYMAPGGRVVDVPLGTYPLYSTCYFVKADGSYSVEWENVNTGLTITVI